MWAHTTKSVYNRLYKTAQDKILDWNFFRKEIQKNRQIDMSYGGTLKDFLRLIFDNWFFYFNVMKSVFDLLTGSFIVPFKNEKCIVAKQK